MLNIIDYSIAFSFFSAGFTLLTFGVKALVEILSPFFSGLEKEETTVEVPEEKTARTRYDVDAYRRRMQKLKESADENGLYEYTITRDKGDNTGAEVITNQYEIDFERRL